MLGREEVEQKEFWVVRLREQKENDGGEGKNTETW